MTVEYYFLLIATGFLGWIWNIDIIITVNDHVAEVPRVIYTPKNV